MYLLTWRRALARFPEASNGTRFAATDVSSTAVDVHLTPPGSAVRPRVRIEHAPRGSGRGLVVSWWVTGQCVPDADGGPGAIQEALDLARAAWSEFLAASPPLGGARRTPWRNGAEWRQTDEVA